MIQTSAMDCGPASLKSLLEGYSIPISYGRLREACQTTVDGTSIDTLEEIAVKVGLPAEQRVVSVDAVLRPEATALPAIAVTRLSNGFTHFVVVWRAFGGFVQVMDPGVGRRWIRASRFLSDLYVHSLPVPAAAWRGFADGRSFLAPLRRALADLGLPARGRALVTEALGDTTWRSLAALDASARMVASVVRAGGLRPGAAVARVVDSLYRSALEQPDGPDASVPEVYWSVRPAPPDPDTHEERLFFRGAVLVSVAETHDDVRDRDLPALVSPPDDEASEPAAAPTELSPELARALSEAPSTPGGDLFALLRVDGWLAPASVLFALALASVSAVTEAVVFRALLDAGRYLVPGHQRFAALGVMMMFLVALMVLEYPLALGLARVGRQLEARLRVAFLTKIPRLGDRYFQSRPTSDMAERSHAVQQIRTLPALGGQLVRACMELVVTAVGLAWLDPSSTFVAAIAAVLAVALPLAVQKPLSELDLRLRTHHGGLARFYLDALQGLVAIRAHAAERSVRREHESLLVEWVHAGRSLLRAVVAVEGVEAVVGCVLTAVLLNSYLARSATAGGALLLVYWALNLPSLGQEIAQLTRQYPGHRNVTLRLLEPLGAAEEGVAEPSDPTTLATPTVVSAAGVAIALRDVTVQAGGHTLLDGLDLTFAPGSHVAIVGASGAGKSSLVGLLLGWHQPAAGRVEIDGRVLDGPRLVALRQETAWIDPAVQLWNQTFLDNLRYGTVDGVSSSLGTVLTDADLRGMLERLPDGLQTRLGEGGALVSGGEGQRVRLGRAMLRRDARLVILDEAFRGLDRETRRALLAHARALWAHATLVCVTHDVAETADFPRVIVIDKGRVLEDDTPAALAANTASRYSALLHAEHTVRREVWTSHAWRRLSMRNGQLSADDDRGAT